MDAPRVRATGLSDGESPDAAIADTSLTRWVNYYVQGPQLG